VDDFVVNVRQIGNYPAVGTTTVADLLLLQQNGIGGPYASINAPDLISTALQLGGSFYLAPGFNISWGAGYGSSTLGFANGAFSFSAPLAVPSLTAGSILSNGVAVATQTDIEAIIAAPVVTSVNGRSGDVQLETDDVLRAGAAPIVNANFGGFNTSPTAWDFRANSDQIATTAFVQLVLQQVLCGGSVVTSFNGRGGAVVLSTADVNAAYANFPVDGIIPTAPNPALGDASNRVATTLFVDDSVSDLQSWLIAYIASGGGVDLSAYAPLASPNFSGVPTAPTAATGVSTGQLATTAFVHNVVVASTTGVSSWNTRTGAVVLTTADITGAGGAVLTSPAFLGTPTAATAAPGTNTTQLATCAFVEAALATGVESFNGRIGVVTFTSGDLTGVGGALLAGPTFTGTPSAPTATPGTSTTQLATTAFVTAAVGAAGGVTTFNSRSGAVTLLNNDISAAGGALLASPAFTGAPTAPTAAPGTNSTQIASTAFVAAAIGVVGGVTSFNTRTGVVTLSTADITGAGGAPLASPILTGTPQAPTAAPGTNTNQIATTAFVLGQGGVTSFNTRTGAVTLALADVTGVGGAPLAGPIFTGVPAAPTASPGTNTTQLATCAFVTNALGTSNVTSFNGRTGSVTFLANDISGAGGALLAGPAFTGTPTAPTANPGTNTGQLATTAFVMAAMATIGGVSSFNGRAGAVNLTLADVTGVGGAPIASPTFTGTPAAPTPAVGDSSTAVATTAFVQTTANAVAVGFVNKFRNTTMINGAHGGSGSVAAGTTVLTLDGWYVSATGAAAAWSQQGPTNLNSFALRVQAAAGLTAIAFMQRIESHVSRQLLNNNRTPGPVTVQFTIYNATSQTLPATLGTVYPNSADAWGSGQTADVSASVQSLPANSLTTVAYTFTPNSGIGLGYQVALSLSGVPATGYIDFGFPDIRATPGVPLGINNNPPPAEKRMVVDDQLFSGRYSQVVGALSLAAATNTSISCRSSFALCPPMRTNPTAVVNGFSTAGDVSGTWQIGPASPSTGQLYFVAAGTASPSIAGGVISCSSLLLTAEL
jgi:hypothetical protein